MAIKILTKPSAVLGYLAPQGGIFEAGTVALRRETFQNLASKTRGLACSPSDAAQIAFHHDLALEAGPTLLRHSEVRKVVEADPFLSLRFLLESYAPLAPLLEPIIKRHPEALCHLMLALEDGKISGAPLPEQFHTALLQGPFWALRYATAPLASPSLGAKRAAFAARLKEHAAQFASSSPECALVHLLINPALSPQPFNVLLSRNAFVAYVASGVLAHRGVSIRLDQVQEFTPRWAVHCALWGHFSEGNQDPRIEPVICCDPAWTGEYLAALEARHQDWTWVESLYNRANATISQNSSPSLASFGVDLLCALIGRIARSLTGDDPRVTFEQFLAEAEKQA